MQALAVQPTRVRVARCIPALVEEPTRGLADRPTQALAEVPAELRSALRSEVTCRASATRCASSACGELGIGAEQTGGAW